MFKQKKERRVGPWGMGSTSQQNPQLQTLIEIISISHWQDPQLWQRGSARGGHCDRLCPWLQTSLSNVAGESSQNRSHKSCLCYTVWSFSLSATALEFSISLFPETEAGTWHLVRKCLLCKSLKKQEKSVFSWVLQTLCQKEPSQQCESILNWMVCMCTTHCGAVCQPGQFWRCGLTADGLLVPMRRKRKEG